MAGCSNGMKSKPVQEDLVIPTITVSRDCNLPRIPGEGNNDIFITNNNNKDDKRNIPNYDIINGAKDDKSNDKGDFYNKKKTRPVLGVYSQNGDSLTSCNSIDTETIYLLVSGKTFCISANALKSFPNTKLGQLALGHSQHRSRVEYVFDRNPKIVAAVLDFYRTRELHLPNNLCSLSVQRELKYWGIPDDLISECCYGRYKGALREMRIVDELENASLTPLHPLPGSTKELIWTVMEKPGSSSASMVWLGVYIMFILLSVILVCISTCRDFRIHRDINNSEFVESDSIFEHLINTELSTPLTVLDIIGLVFFTIEPLVRLWACPDRKEHMQEILNVLDFLLAADHWLCLAFEASDPLMNRDRSARITVTVLRSLLSLRVFRIFHLTRRNVKTKVLLLTFKASLIDIMLLLLGLSIGVMIFATLIYYAEMLNDTDNFQNIPQAVWWAIITMTTVGYGDYYPTAVPGYVVGVACALSGLLLLSMPIAVTATNFNTYYCGLVAQEQRQRRNAALKRVTDLRADKKRDKYNREDLVNPYDSDLTLTTHCDDESIDDSFWMHDVSDYKNQCQSDGAINRSVVSQRDKAIRSSSVLYSHSYSESSLFSKAKSSESFLLPKDIHLSNQSAKHAQKRYSRPSNNLQTEPNHYSSILSATKGNFPNYNSVNTECNCNCFPFNKNPPKSKKTLTEDTMKKQKRKYRARKKVKGSLPHLPKT